MVARRLAARVRLEPRRSRASSASTRTTRRRSCGSRRRTSRDRSPRWSPDGNAARVRAPARHRRRARAHPRAARTQPWSIWTADASTGEGTPLWKAPDTLRGSLPDHARRREPALGGRRPRSSFLSYIDGWPHLYSMPATGGDAAAPDAGRRSWPSTSRSRPDGRSLVFAAQHRPRGRRHRPPPRRARARRSRRARGADAGNRPRVDAGRHGRRQSVAFLAPPRSVRRCPRCCRLGRRRGALARRGPLPADFPTAQLVTPQPVTYKSPDGLSVHAQLFERADGRRQEAGHRLRPRRPAAPDAARLALLGLLRERVRARTSTSRAAASWCSSVNYRLGHRLRLRVPSPARTPARRARRSTRT